MSEPTEPKADNINTGSRVRGTTLHGIEVTGKVIGESPSKLCWLVETKNGNGHWCQKKNVKVILSEKGSGSDAPVGSSLNPAPPPQNTLAPCPFCQIEVEGKFHEMIEHPDVEGKPCVLNGGVFFGFKRWNTRTSAPCPIKESGEEGMHFHRKDGCSGNGYLCEGCGEMWVNHLVPNSTCPCPIKDEGEEGKTERWKVTRESGFNVALRNGVGRAMLVAPMEHENAFWDVADNFNIMFSGIPEAKADNVSAVLRNELERESWDANSLYNTTEHQLAGMHNESLERVIEELRSVMFDPRMHFTYEDLWKAYEKGANNADENPKAGPHNFRQAADAYCKLIHAERDPKMFAALGTPSVSDSNAVQTEELGETKADVSTGGPAEQKGAQTCSLCGGEGWIRLDAPDTRMCQQCQGAGRV